MRRSGSLLLAMLAISTLINYVDRGALSVAIPAMEGELSLTPLHKGILLSGFFWTYALMQLPAGWLVDRFEVKRVYAAGYLVWTGATALTGLVRGFVLLLFARLLLGLGESVAYPAISRLVSERFPEERRGLANALIDASTKVGPALSILVGGLFVEAVGWRILFVLLGVGGLLWLIPWVYLMKTLDGGHESVSTPQKVVAGRPGFGRLLVHPAVWGTSLGMFSLGYVWYFLLTWLPSYFVDAHGFDLQATAFLAALPFLAMAVVTTLAGWFSDRLISRGGSPTIVRKGIALGGMCVAAALLLATSLTTSPTLCVALLTAACCALGLFTANVWAMTQTMAGPAAGSWTGVQNCIGNFGGVASPLVAGWTVGQTGSYSAAFYVAAGVMILGALAYLGLVGPIRPVDWFGVSSEEEPLALAEGGDLAKEGVA